MFKNPRSGDTKDRVTGVPFEAEPRGRETRLNKAGKCGWMGALILATAACGTAPETLIMSRRTGLTGSGEITQSTLRNSGDMTIRTEFETFTGRWVAVRDGASQGLALLQAYAGGSVLRGAADLLADTEAGYGTAILTSDGGRSMRCEFRYTGVQITAIGVCETTDGEVFDLQVS